MIRVILYISGKVQRVNYRSKVINKAEKYNIKGNIQNLSDNNVKIIAEGEEKDIELFIQDINIKNTLINVSDIKMEYSTPTGEYESFYKLVSEGETDERLDTAANLLKELINVTKKGFSGIEKKQEIMIVTQQETIGKIDNLGIVLGNKIDQNRLEIKSEIHALRDDFKSHFDKRLSKMEFELAEIKIKVNKIQHSSNNPRTKISQAE
ncbi:MAG: acylphosphatase [Candidatus Methanoperedens sp.]|nr:acylphosphatase [Candidatus Methanoperedens sp.]